MTRSDDTRLPAACLAPMTPALPPPEICEQARQARDARFDGVFFTAVRTTGIYCRPVCPVPPARANNVEYHATAASAEAAGFRPCLRCRPELSPADGSWRRGDSIVARALRLIEAGALNQAPLSALAERLHVGERHLRRLFESTLGASPHQVHNTRRLLLAKQLLTESTLPIIQVAEAAGFQSLRRFNDAFRTAYGMAPRQLRKPLHSSHSPTDNESGHEMAGLPGPESAEPALLTLKLGYRPPLDFPASLDFLKQRMLPGIESVDEWGYSRVIDASGAWLRITSPARTDGADPAVQPASSAYLNLSLHGVEVASLPVLIQRVRRMFDLDADPVTVAARFAPCPIVGPLITRQPGLRLPGGWDGFEVAIRAVLGQQVSVAAATTIARRLVDRHGQRVSPHPGPSALHSLFPTPEQLACLPLQPLIDLGLPSRRAQTIRTVAQAVASGQVGFEAEQSLDTFITRWTALPGIGDWTAQYIALRGWLHPDAFPAGDLILRRQAGGGGPISEKALRELAEAWRPWRGYAVIHLWRANG